MAEPTDEIDDELLGQIRRAAFELRHEDTQEAVRTLRRTAGKGPAAEVLSRGALGEIYLEELGDLDGAEHEFRRVLELAPLLAAAELGLARVRREQGRAKEADAGYCRAIAGLQRDVRTFRDAGQVPPGAEEVVLTLLEVARELCELRGEKAQMPLDEALLEWAEGARLFDAIADEDPDNPDGAEAAREDWGRFHAGWAQLRAITGHPAEAVAQLQKAEAGGRLSAAQAARLLRDAHEDAGDLRAAAEQGLRLLREDKAAETLDVLRAAALSAASGDEPSAARVLTEALEKAKAAGRADDVKLLSDALEPEPGAGGLVKLGLKPSGSRPPG